jgi:hypothetical protein
MAASAGILAGLLLERNFINQVLWRDIMQQSVIYQEWREEGEQAGALKEGQLLILSQLLCRIGEVSPEMRRASATKVVRKSKPCPSLSWKPSGEALLDFTNSEDLNEWMQLHLQA